MTFKTIRSPAKGVQKGAQVAIVRKQPPARPAPDAIVNFQEFSKFLETHEQVFATLLKQRLGRFRGTMAQWAEEFEKIKKEPGK